MLFNSVAFDWEVEKLGWLKSPISTRCAIRSSLLLVGCNLI